MAQALPKFCYFISMASVIGLTLPYCCQCMCVLQDWSTGQYWGSPIGTIVRLPKSYMVTSSHGKIFRVTGHLCGKFTGEFPAQRPVTRSFDVFFDLRLNRWLSKQPWGWWFEMPSWSLWRHRNEETKHPSLNCEIPALLATVPYGITMTSSN